MVQICPKIFLLAYFYLKKSVYKFGYIHIVGKQNVGKNLLFFNNVIDK